MQFLLLAGLLSAATALPIPLEQFGGSTSEQRFGFFPPPGPPFFPQILFPPPPPPQLPLVLTLNDLITLITSILNQLGGFIGAIKGQMEEVKALCCRKCTLSALPVNNSLCQKLYTMMLDI